jgi:hypothetical protein
MSLTMLTDDPFHPRPITPIWSSQSHCTNSVLDRQSSNLQCT